MEVPASQPKLYALSSECYAVNNLVGFINGIAKAHWAVKNDPSRHRVYQVIHITIALVEAFPGVGHVVALFELILVRGVRWLLLKPPVIVNDPLQPNPIEIPEFPLDDPVMPIPEAPAFGPSISRPLSFSRVISSPVQMNYPLVPFCVPPRQRAPRISPFICFTFISMNRSAVPFSVFEAVFARPAECARLCFVEQEPMALHEAPQQVYPIVPFRGLINSEQAALNQGHVVVSVLLEQPVVSFEFIGGNDLEPLAHAEPRVYPLIPLHRRHEVVALSRELDFSALVAYPENGEDLPEWDFPVPPGPFAVARSEQQGINEVALEIVPSFDMSEARQQTYFQMFAGAAYQAGSYIGKSASVAYEVGSIGVHQVASVGYQAGVVGYDIVCNEPRAVQVLDTWFTKMTPAFHQLCPELLEKGLEALVSLQHPVMASAGYGLFGRNALSWGANQQLSQIMGSYRPIVVVDSSDIGQAVHFVANAGDMAVSSGGCLKRAMRRTAHVTQRVCTAVTGCASRRASHPALSQADAKDLAECFSDALRRTIDEALENIAQSNQVGSRTAHFFLHSPTGRLLSYLGDSLVIKIVENAISSINRTVNVQFTQSRVVNAFGSVVVGVIVSGVQRESFELPEGLLETIEAITAHLPPYIEAAQRAVFNLHFLEACKDLYIIHNAVMKTGEIDFNLILASKKYSKDDFIGFYGDRSVANACANICLLVSGGDLPFARKMEKIIRDILAVGQLIKQGVSDEQSLVLAMAGAMAQDGWISRESHNAASMTVSQATRGLVEWWGAPSGPAIQQFKQLCNRSALEASGNSAKASNPHIADATVNVLQEATRISGWNRASAVAVQASRVPFTYMLSGDIVQALLTATKQIAIDEGIAYAAGRVKNAAIHQGVHALSLDDGAATAIKQFCVFTDLLVEGMNGCFNEEAERGITHSSSSSSSSLASE